MAVPATSTYAALFDTRSEASGVYELKNRRRIACAVDRFPPDHLAALLDDPEAPFAHPEAVVVKSGRSTKLVRTRLFDDRRPLVSYKRARRRGWLHRLKERFRRPRALRSWNRGREFLRSGIATAKPVCIVVPRGFWNRGDCYVATEWIAGGRKLDQYIHQAATLPGDRKRRMLRTLAETLGHTIGRLHAAGFSHRDLKEENIIVQTNGDAVSVYVIDLDGAAKYRRVPWKRRIRDLSRMFISVLALQEASRTDYLRFLRVYFQVTGEPASSRRSAWRQIQRDGQRRLRRKARKRHNGLNGCDGANVADRRAA